MLDDATGYGRVLRNESGDVTRIVEHKDATDDERRVNEINTGLIAFDARRAAPLPRQLEEQQRAARVLPDRRHRAWRSRTRSTCDGIVADSPTEVLGINDRAQLAAAERALAAAASARSSWRAA